MNRMTNTRIKTFPYTAPNDGSMILLRPPIPSAARMLPRSLPTPARHHDQERVDDVVLPQIGAHVADLGQRAACQPGQAGAERERARVDPSRAHAEARGHSAVLRDGADPEAGVRAEEQHVHR